MTEAPDRKARLRVLLEQLREEGMTQETIAQRIGVSQTLVSAILRGAKQGADAIEHAKRGLDLHEDFFSDPAAEGRRYSDFVGGSPLRDTRVERDDAQSPYPEVEQFIADEADAGRPIEKEHIAELRAFRLHRATVLSPYDTAASMLTQMRAAARGKALPRKRVRPGDL